MDVPLKASTEFVLREGMANSTGITENSIVLAPLRFDDRLGPSCGPDLQSLMDIKGLWSKYGKYGKYAILAGLVGDVVVLGGG
jgi:hypothetical protein